MALSDLTNDGMLTDIDARTHGALAVHEKRDGERQVAAFHWNGIASKAAADRV